MMSVFVPQDRDHPPAVYGGMGRNRYRATRTAFHAGNAYPPILSPVGYMNSTPPRMSTPHASLSCPPDPALRITSSTAQIGLLHPRIILKIRRLSGQHHDSRFQHISPRCKAQGHAGILLEPGILMFIPRTDQIRPCHAKPGKIYFNYELP